MKVKNKKSLGQNFIFDKNFLAKISNSIVSKPNNTIIEIGPGPGTLTNYLFKKDYNKMISDYSLSSAKGLIKIIFVKVGKCIFFFNIFFIIIRVR